MKRFLQFKRFLWMVNQSFVNLPFDKEKNNNIITW